MGYLKHLGAALALAAAATAHAGPLSKMYLSYTGIASYAGIGMVQGNSVSSFASAYTVGGLEIPIAVDGDVRTTGFLGAGSLGGQYSLSGTPTGVSYANPGFEAYDGTTDGSYNYVVDYQNGNVIRTDRDFQNPVTLFNVGGGHLGITYDPSTNSLWISGWNDTSDVTNYSMSGAVLSSFSTGFNFIGALALDHADNSLWLVDNSGATNELKQYSKSGSLLGSGPDVGYTLGGEFDLAGARSVPEPSTWLMLSGSLLLLARRRRPSGAAR
ncbi:MAG: PEP-CTERM sorting domain-containing protein [Rubrivivax sp.]